MMLRRSKISCVSLSRSGELESQRDSKPRGFTYVSGWGVNREKPCVISMRILEGSRTPTEPTSFKSGSKTHPKIQSRPAYNTALSLVHLCLFNASSIAETSSQALTANVAQLRSTSSGAQCLALNPLRTLCRIRRQLHHSRVKRQYSAQTDSFVRYC